MRNTYDPLVSVAVPLNVVEEAEMLKVPLSASIPVFSPLAAVGIAINLTL